MKLIFCLMVGAVLSLAACGSSNAECQGDHCVCTDDCDHVCSEGAAECHVQGAPNRPVDVTCDNNLECHVECMSSSSCMVDCGGSTECNVTCPATGCTVTNCSGAACIVSCGLIGAATRNGNTATCP